VVIVQMATGDRPAPLAISVLTLAEERRIGSGSSGSPEAAPAIVQEVAAFSPDQRRFGRRPRFRRGIRAAS